MLTALLSVVLVLTPGVYAWWASRRLVHRMDDPLFPDFMLTHSQRVGAVVGVAVAVGIFFAREYLGYVMVAMVLAVVVAGFPARKRIYEETWSLGGYLAHTARFWFALFGFFFIVALSPAAMALVDEAALAVGVAMGAVAMLGLFFSARLVPRILGARRLDRPALKDDFDDVLSKARCGPPELYEADAPGGTFVNAFAVPSWTRPGVLFTKGLLEALSPAETKAIFAHEIAHLEHHNRRHLLKGYAASLVLVALPVFVWAGPLAESLRGWEWVWPLLLFLGLLAKLQRHRAHESESDVRAVELAGDPEALVSALTKIHTLLRLSRRWSEKFERRATHPSLARRIHAIRRAAGVSSEEPIDPVVVLSKDTARAACVLDAEKFHWLSGVPEDEGLDLEELLARSEERRSIAYADLRDLRLRGSGEKREIVFTTKDGRTERMPVAAEVVPGLSAVLDRIDSRIGYAPATEPVPKGRLASLVLLVLGLSPPYSLVVVALALLALAMPEAITLAAVGAAGLATALANVTRPDPWGIGVGPLRMALLVGTSAIPVWLAIKRYRLRLDASRRASVAAALAGLVLLLSSCLGLFRLIGSELARMQLHLWAREHASAFIASVALFAMLSTFRRSATKAAALLTVVLACLLLWVSSLGFRERLTGDIFRARAPELPTHEVSLTETRAFPVEGTVSKILLAPGGSRVALSISEYDEHYEPGPARYLVETSEGVLQEVEALALDFVSASEIAALTRDGDETVLRVGEPEAFSHARTIRLPPLVDPELDVAAGSPEWRVLGARVDGTMSVLVSGRFDDGSRKETLVRNEQGFGETHVLGPRGFVLNLGYVYPDWNDGFLPASLLLWAWSRPTVTDLSVRRTGEDDSYLGRTALPLRCFHTRETEESFLCATTEAGSTALWKLDPRRGMVEAVGSLEGFFYGDFVGSSGQMAFQRWMGRPLLVDWKKRRVALPALPSGGTKRRSLVERFLYGGELDATDWGILAWRDDVLARAQTNYETGDSTVTLYAIGGRAR